MQEWVGSEYSEHWWDVDDRIIVITDEQSHTEIPGPKGRGYFINVASYRNGIGYGAWVHLDGFSESVIDWIREYEANSRSHG